MTFKALFFIVDRANYGRLFPVIKNFQDDSRFTVETCFLGNSLLSAYGDLVVQAEKDGIPVSHKIYSSIVGSTHTTMVLTIANVTAQVGLLLDSISPDIVILIGDRYEALGCAIASAYKNVLVAHFQGGEVSGTIDETTRHLITKISHLHFPATELAATRIRSMGENPSNVHPIGCPVSDITSIISSHPFDSDVLHNYIPSTFLKTLNRGYILCCMHPVTTAPVESAYLSRLIRDVLIPLGMPIVWILPNIDPGSNEIHQQLSDEPQIYYISNVMPLDYQYLLYHASVAVGNSSSYIRDSSLHGTPVVSVGTRQVSREISSNVISLPDPTYKTLNEAIHSQLSHGRYPANCLYGSGGVADKAANIVFTFLAQNNSPQKSWHA